MDLKSIFANLIKSPSTFNIKSYINPLLFNVLCLYGAYKLANKFLYFPIEWGYRQFIRKGYNLKERYQTKWALVTSASEGIGE